MVRIPRIGMLPAAGLTLLAAFSFAHQSAPATSQPATRPVHDSNQWKRDIAAFAAGDSRNTPPRDAVLFVGSSSIVHWETARAFPDLTVINRGFGGSVIEDVTHFADEVIVRYHPRLIVFYSGDNDVASGLTAAQVAEDFAALVRRIRRDLPQTPMVVLSIKPSRARWALWPTMKDANARIAAICSAEKNLTYVDVGAALLDEHGEPRAELFVADQLHLSPAGYAEWNRILTPVLQRIVGAAQGDRR